MVWKPNLVISFWPKSRLLCWSLCQQGILQTVNVKVGHKNNCKRFITLPNMLILQIMTHMGRFMSWEIFYSLQTCFGTGIGHLLPSGARLKVRSPLKSLIILKLAWAFGPLWYSLYDTRSMILAQLYLLYDTCSMILALWNSLYDTYSIILALWYLFYDTHSMIFVLWYTRSIILTLLHLLYNACKQTVNTCNKIVSFCSSCRSCNFSLNGD